MREENTLTFTSTSSWISISYEGRKCEICRHADSSSSHLYLHKTTTDPIFQQLKVYAREKHLRLKGVLLNKLQSQF